MIFFIMQGRLKNILMKAKAPITGRKVACIIIGENREEHSGYNIETKKKIFHAEEKALAGIKKPFLIKEIHMMASGRPMNVKYAIPCEKCSNFLLPFSTIKTKILFYFYNDDTKKFILNFKDLVSNYISFNNIPELKNKKINFFLKNNTPLTNIDQKVLSKMYEIILSHSSNDCPIEMYITGSSSGRGGPKSILAKKITGSVYWDLDLLLIFPKKTPKNVNKLIKDIYKDSLSFVDWKHKNILEKNMPSYRLEELKKDSKHFMFRKVYWTKGMELEIHPPDYKKRVNAPSSIDVSVGKFLNATITHKYLNKKWYIKLI